MQTFSLSRVRRPHLLVWHRPGEEEKLEERISTIGVGAGVIDHGTSPTHVQAGLASRIFDQIAKIG